ncbi:MAG: M1 family aminopeptidase [Flavobacteriaceae bacterium]|nr:M1 family aminopeptidase [Flavobacteriaceae bacterium]
MKRFIFFLLLVLFSTNIAFSQQYINSSQYRAEREKINNLVHTKLKVDFNFEKSQLNGEAWVTLKPHFYPTNKVTLDAKAMLIHEVKLNGSKIPFNYHNNELTIELGRSYSSLEKYEVYIKYTARPEEVKEKGSEFIKDAKGLYFINPKGLDPNKPTQIWTQGETEASSCWFPTIDSPNQKSTQEIYMTVPEKFTTLSNGKLISQTKNSDKTRTDYWKMDQAHAPYLFFMAVGEFSVVKDTWKGKSVDYYVEKEYESAAKDIFGKTPKMLDFFSNLTGIEYPWDKYSQIVGRDFVSGAMENTTAVIHAENAYQTKNQLIDENIWENTIAHELFHHWFGNLVTAESWSNLTLNESFANYSEYLWLEHEYGKDEADAHLYEDIQRYFESPENESKNLVRFEYRHREDMFDLVSYNKGGAILHMLRNFMGDEAFFESIKRFLKQRQYNTAEATHFRLIAEEVSGKDLNWFFNQWYYGNGHVKFSVNYTYNKTNNTVTVAIKQNEKVFEFPLTIDIYEPNGVSNYTVWVDAKEKTFTFNYTTLPKLINVNANKSLLAAITDAKTIENFIYQYQKAPKFLDRREAIVELAKHQTNKEVFKTMTQALNDKYFEIRILALENIDLFDKNNKKEAIAIIENIAKNDPKTLVRAKAIMVLGKLVDLKYKSLFEDGIKHLSMAIKGNSISALYQLDKKMALNEANKLDSQTKDFLAPLLVKIYISEKDQTQDEYISKHLIDGMFSTDKATVDLYTAAYNQIAKSNNKEVIQNLVNDFVKKGKQYKKYNFDKAALYYFQQMLTIQQTEKHNNKEELIMIIRKGMAELVE